MAEIPIPFVDREVDTEDPGDSAKTMVMLLVGGTLFFAMLAYMQRGANRVTSAVDSLLGVGSGSGNEVDIV